MTIAASAAVLTACGRSPSAGTDPRAFVMTGICPVGTPVGDGRTVARDSVDSEDWGWNYASPEIPGLAITVGKMGTIGDGGSLAAARAAFTTKAIAAPVALGSGAFELPGRGVCRVFFEANNTVFWAATVTAAGQRVDACSLAADAAEATVK
jgi:hypothetical protein